MRGVGCFLVLFGLAAGTAAPQQGLPPSIQEGPMTVPASKTPAASELAAPVAAQVGSSTAQVPPPVADGEGFFRPGPGVVAPKLENAEPVKLPKDIAPSETPRICFYTVGVSGDGSPAEIETIRASDDAVCQIGAETISQLRFIPGTIDGKATPVRVRVTLRFRPGADSAALLVQGSGARLGNSDFAGQTREFDTPPVATHTQEAEYSEEARRAGVEGTVLIEVTVSVEGLPTNIRVLRPVEKGLSEKAVQAVSQYRFRPALKDGKPVAATIDVEVSFHLYRRPNY